ncbi:MAG: CRISPR-associated protein Cas4 [Chloroflexi bacterium]|nr:CRISPR-associated protein Cas4 [Chloroflexota bacterium]
MPDDLPPFSTANSPQVTTIDPGLIADDVFTFRVTDLKQYAYCPRILYYQTILPQVRPITYKMEAGIEAHRAAEQQEQRRSLRPYGIAQGERIFNLPLVDVGLMLSGVVDMVIATEAELIPVDYKQAQKEGPHYRLQLAAYGCLLERQPSTPPRQVKRGFLYLLPLRRAIEVPFTPALRRQLDAALLAMGQIARDEHMPLPTSQRARCVDCEFRRFCNDI